MNFPLDLTFKILAVATQMHVRDASGSTVGYMKQRLLKLREDINVFADQTQSRLLYNIKADRIIDMSARYTFTDDGKRVMGAIKRRGMRSIWKANYEVFDAAGSQVMAINEENGWVKVWDSLIAGIPVIGLFSGYLFHPVYLVTRMNGEQVARLEKLPALFEGKFRLAKTDALGRDEEPLLLLSMLTMTLLERSRG